MLAVVCEGIRFVTVYAPNGRVVGTPFYEGKLAWFERLRHWLAESASPSDDLVLAGDFNITPADEDVWDPAAAHGGTHVSEPERRARPSPRLGFGGRFSSGPTGDRSFLVVGLPSRDVSQELRDEDRPALCDGIDFRSNRLVGNRSGGEERPADAIRSRSRGARPRYARRGLRCRVAVGFGPCRPATAA